jgi:hypothetical protein
MTGSVVAACTRETSAGALGASTTSHWAPTDCIQVPVQLIRMPIHSQRKARLLNGAQAEASGATVLVVKYLLGDAAAGHRLGLACGAGRVHGTEPRVSPFLAGSHCQYPSHGYRIHRRSQHPREGIVLTL